MSIGHSIKRFASLVKFSHTIFALPFAMIGFSYAIFYQGHPFIWYKLLYVIACMVTARNAAMGFNRWLDRHIDALNPRTLIREIPSGIISEPSAFAFVVVNGLLFCAFSYLLRPLCGYLAPVALFTILFYSYTKRFTALCHLILGIGLSLAPIGAHLAVAGTFTPVTILIGIVVMAWVSGFDIIYALQDEEFDKQHELHSIPALLGKRNALIVSKVLHVIAAVLVIVIGLVAHLSFIYWIGAITFIGLLIYQHTLVSPHNLSKVNVAFFTTNGIGSIVYALFFILSLIIQ
jgi:4-hydroxybenzoate polyprenyltransferase